MGIFFLMVHQATSSAYWKFSINDRKQYLEYETTKLVELYVYKDNTSMYYQCNDDSESWIIRNTKWKKNCGPGENCWKINLRLQEE